MRMPVDQPISVLMPVRNGAKSVGMAVHDMLASAQPHDEVLVVDDGSEDSTPEVLKNIDDPRLRVINTRGIGLVDALNLGLREVSHSWVARADADDRYPRDRLDNQRACRQAGVVLISGDYSFVSKSHVIAGMPTALTHPFVLTSLIHPQRIPHPGVLLHREAVLSVGAYRVSDFPVEDLALWLRLSAAGAFVGTPHIVVHWTMSSTSVTHSNQILQRAKASTLLRENFPWPMMNQVLAESVTGELNAYASTRLAGERAVLLLRDLRQLDAKGYANAAYRLTRRTVLGSPLEASRASLGLLAGKLRRGRARKRI